METSFIALQLHSLRLVPTRLEGMETRLLLLFLRLRLLVPTRLEGMETQRHNHDSHLLFGPDPT